MAIFQWVLGFDHKTQDNSIGFPGIYLHRINLVKLKTCKIMDEIENFTSI